MHLVVIHHGMWGNSSHLAFIEKKLLSVPSVAVLNIKSNSGLLSYDGIDTCGLRVIDEIKEYVKTNASIELVSFIGYSLGGLILRYSVGILFEEKFFETYKPIFFATFATPHLGSCKPEVSVFNRVFNALSSFLTGRSGNQLNIVDKNAGNNPLLVVMADVNSSYHKALALFKHRSVYANARNDFIVRVNKLSTLLIEVYNCFNIRYKSTSKETFK